MITVDTHNYPIDVTLDDIIDLLRTYAKKVEELEEQNEQLREIVEEHKQKRFR